MTHDDRPSFSHLATPEKNETAPVAAVPRPVFSSPDAVSAAPAEQIDPRAHGRGRVAGSQRRR
ncbi:hypothetical protein [Nocardia higoensis]|uniref:hypothetical protein n=1 Tax=Nocardia higoensis TaxID=228599 RepID=UPI0002DAC9B6|nr:hypothetical protein [Nocardia higoensis]